MDLRTTVDSRTRLARTLLIVVLAAVALRSLWKGKRVRGVLVGAVAVALGYSAVSGSRDLAENLGIDTDAVTGPRELDPDIGIDSPSEEGELRCAVCGDPIVPGERRRPNEDGDTVHEACLEAAA